jgi:Protein of unknown function (DUF4231)
MRMDKNLMERMDIMHTAAGTYFTSEAREASWSKWRDTVVMADRMVNINKRAFYSLRIVVLVAAITVPSLVGLNLSGTGGTVVRWLTFGFSLIAAILTSILTLYRLGERWLMYRKLKEDLMKIGWTLIESSSAGTQQAPRAWGSFISNTDKIIAEYNKTYETTVIQTAQASLEYRPDGSVKEEQHS